MNLKQLTIATVGVHWEL
uniref:Uncharacterized protein n=1 Tax=Rhizophora mucronata TaxID=61149 RepID=A0A2P2QI19_RHIMU